MTTSGCSRHASRSASHPAASHHSRGASRLASRRRPRRCSAARPRAGTFGGTRRCTSRGDGGLRRAAAWYGTRGSRNARPDTLRLHEAPRIEIAGERSRRYKPPRHMRSRQRTCRPVEMHRKRRLTRRALTWRAPPRVKVIVEARGPLPPRRVVAVLRREERRVGIDDDSATR
eukprot:4315537-Prymnesium_polylepis.2